MRPSDSFRPILPAVPALLALVLLAPRAGAQCAVVSQQPVAAVLEIRSTQRYGESFVACQDGAIPSLTIGNAYATRPDVIVGLEPGADLTTPAYAETLAIESGFRRFRLTTPFPVEAGNVYSFSITPLVGVLGLAWLPQANYPDGTALAVVDGQTVAQDGDLEFSIFVFPNAPVPARPATWGELKAVYR